MQTNYLAAQADDIYMTSLIKSRYALVVRSQQNDHYIYVVNVRYGIKAL